jgi:DNA-binding CsgD family transcriptional regulator/PAS domain-containing protein
MGGKVRTAARLLDVTEHLCGAATNAAAWTSALNALTVALEADHAIIVVREKTDGSMLVATSAGMRITDFDRFLSPQGSRWMEPFCRALPAGQAVKWSDIVPDRTFERSEFYNEVVRPVNGFYAIAALQKSSTLSTFIAACRPRRSGDFPSAAAAAMQRVLPHVSVAATLRHRLQLAENQHKQLVGILDRLLDGVVVVDAAGHIVFVNRAGMRLVRGDNGLRLDRRQLVPADPASHEALRRLIEQSTHIDLAQEKAKNWFHIARGERRDPLHAFVAPYGGIEQRDAGEGLAIVLLADPEKTRTADKNRWRRQFGLTAAEASLAAEIVKGDGRQACAERLGISLATARTHLTHIFDKTGTRRQAALVRLLLSHSGERAGHD